MMFADHRVNLDLNSDPPSAQIIVMPVDQSLKPYQCTAPCNVLVPRHLGIRIIAVLPGYVMAPIQDPVSWVKKDGAWAFDRDGVVLHLKPVGLPSTVK